MKTTFLLSAIAFLSLLTPNLVLGQGSESCEVLLDSQPNEPVDNFERLICRINIQSDLNKSHIIAVGLLSSLEGFDGELLDELTNLIEDHPESAILYAERAHAYSRLGLHSQSESDVDTALSLDPSIGTEYYYALIPNLTQLTFPESLSTDVNSSLFDYANWAIALSPDTPEVYQLRAFFFFLDGKYDEARPDFESALGIDPQFDEAYVGLGLIEIELTNYLNAIEQLDIALEIEPNNYLGRLALGRAHFELEDYDTALTEFNKLIEDVPNSIAPRFWRSLIFIEQEEWELAVDEITLVLEAETENPTPYCLLGDIYVLLVNGDEAAKNYSQCLKLAGDRSSDYPHAVAFLERWETN